MVERALMRAYKVIRKSGTDESSGETIKIWDGESLLWERDAGSFVDFEGQMIKLSALTDLQIVELYRKEHE
jgi:hypothetical protein